jgi:hypothetical protein
MSAKQRAKIRLEHRAFGWGVIKRSRYTEAGAEVFDAQFDDCKHRTVLAAPEFWVSNQSEVEQAFADLLETKPAVRIPEGSPQRRMDRSLPSPVYEVIDGDAYETVASLLGDSPCTEAEVGE